MENVKEKAKENVVNIQPRPVKVRGTAVFHDGGDMEFVAQRKGEPVQRSVRKKGDSRFYETEGEKDSSYVCHLKVPKTAEDPAAQMFEELQYFTKGMQAKEPAAPKSKKLLEKPGLSVWHRKQENKVIVMMEVSTENPYEMSSVLFNLTSEVNKCFAINRTLLSPQKK